MPAAIVIGLQPRLGSMKWENPPLSLFAIPPLAGLFSSFIGFQLAPMIHIQEKMLDDILPLILSWLILILFAEILMLQIPKKWGNPKEKDYYDYMKSYSPYDNVEAKAYPHTLVLAGYNDPRVPYWEPAKWTAKLRNLKKDDNDLLLKTIMGAGHFSSSGRFDYLKDVAFYYAFILDKLEIN